MKYSLAILLLLFTSKLFAQTDVSGLVLDKNNVSQPYTPVLLTHAKDTTTFIYTLTDSTGRFDFKVNRPGNYFIRIKTMGFKSYQSTNFFLDPAKNEQLNLPDVILEDDITALKEFTVTGRKPLFEQKTDRLVFNVENALSAQGSDAVDALKNTPLLKVDDKSIGMVGKNNLNIMINGRPIALHGETLLAYLGTISSDQISRIEIITTPPARYSAEGNAGLINIILKKNPNLGLNGTVNLAATQRSNFSGRSSANINYQTEKFSLASSLSYNHNRIDAYETNENLFSNTFRSNNRQDKQVLSKDFAPSLNLNYKINSRSDVSLIYEYNGSDFSSDDRSENLFFNQENLNRRLLNNGYGTIKGDYHRVHTYLNRQLDTLGKSVELGFQWLGNNIRNERSNQITTNNAPSATHNSSLNNYKLAVTNLDFTLPFKKVNIQTGARHAFLDNHSDVRFFDIINQIPELNPALTNVFNYREHIFSLYTSAEMKLGKKWSMQGGIRYENTRYDGKSESGGDKITRNYGNLFPTFYTSYSHSDKASYSFRYSKRVSRPKLDQLNPFQWFINPLQYVEGNPLLMPSFSDNLELSYSNNSNFGTTLYHSITRDQISYFANFLNDGETQRYSFYNLLDIYQYGVFSNYTFNKMKNLESMLSGSLYWQKTSSKDEILMPSTRGSGANLYWNNSYKAGSDNLIQLSYTQSFPSFDGTLETNAYGFLTLAYRRTLLNKQLSLGLTASTILSKGYEVSYRQLNSNAILNGRNEYDYQSVRLNLSYKFGNAKLKTKRQKSAAEEAGRIK